jgi:bifunctional non-homologous end joining protein LigD
MRPVFICPCSPASAVQPPSGPAWLHEPKLDGFRTLVTKDGDRVLMLSKSGAECTEKLPRMVEWFARLPAHRLVLDGELVLLNADGTAIFTN